MPKINWKKVGSFALGVGEQLFPVLSVVEKLAQLKKLDSKGKQDEAFKLLHDELVKNLLPKQAQDPRLEVMIRKLIDDGVALNNLLAELKNDTVPAQPVK